MIHWNIKRIRSSIGVFINRTVPILFFLFVIYICAIDTPIIESGQIGHLTVIFYYLVYVVSILFYGLGLLIRGQINDQAVVFVYWIVTGLFPLFFTVYGFGGPD